MRRVVVRVVRSNEGGGEECGGEGGEGGEECGSDGGEE